MCFDPGLVANLANFVYSTALIREKKKNKNLIFVYFMKLSKENPTLGNLGSITWLKLFGTGLHP